MAEIKDDGKVRTFGTGATRDTSEGKPVPWRYGSAIVAKLYGEYMKRHQKQSDGNFRAGDNWKKGFGIDVLNDSLSRHIQDYWLHHDGHPGQATEQDVLTVLLAVKFNVDALILEHWTKQQEPSTPIPEPNLTYQETHVILQPGEIKKVNGRTLHNDTDVPQKLVIPALQEFASPVDPYFDCGNGGEAW